MILTRALVSHGLFFLITLALSRSSTFSKIKKTFAELDFSIDHDRAHFSFFGCPLKNQNSGKKKKDQPQAHTFYSTPYSLSKPPQKNLKVVTNPNSTPLPL